MVGRPSLQAASAWFEQIQRFYHVPTAHEELVLTLDGAPHFFDLRISPLADRHGSTSGRLVVLRDITERKQAMEALERAREEQAASAHENARLYQEANEQRQYFEALMNNSPIAVASTDLDDRIVTCNQAFEQLFGSSQVQVVGRSLVEVISSPKYYAEVERNLSRIKQGEVIHVMTRWLGRHLEAQGVPVLVDGRIVGAGGEAAFRVYLA